MKKQKHITFEEFEKELLKDPEFKKEYDLLEPEFAIIEAILKKRIESGLSQKQLAEKIGTKQSAISRIENGNANPSLKFLQKIAKGLDTKLKISFV
ncbi:MAG: helix-turn-helix transcriptional regulator [Candidatus Pacebacteria bacterium]|nr:helix-turn-helix transcriptional regulator [Candidatus Paceibacterota bacterium]MBT4652837.1 helix-turn-helix transcriptional regulator [Candidatus Paceibacterota bacterium]MBT6755776.1 helix-turn-helix transcriptional regulator [Candidatus Paceibacterota bacterium]